MNLLNKYVWKHLWSIYTLSSRQVFELVKPPDTPILIPVLFVCIASTLILWVLMPILYSIIGVTSMDDSIIPAELVEFSLTSILKLVIWVPTTVLALFVALVLLGTYFFIIGRRFRIDISWKHWLGFAAWINIPMVLTLFGTSLLSVWGHTPNPSPIVFVSLIVMFIILPLVWAVVLCVQGLRIWTEREMSFCVWISLLPYFVYAILTTLDIIYLAVQA
ncbi:MAG: hypothetical protein F4W92_09260 [Gammaproteobacteria bacterium]|nr:hypothetical protein [Gammaproteobacteria bacterium]